LDFSGLRPAGGKRSSKRDRILNLFLRQKGHLSADDLCDLVRKDDSRIGRATVYRTLQWMVNAGIARKVDFGEGRSRFEPSYRHPRHFHLVCNVCHRSSEFLSSDVEAIVEEIASARNFEAAQSVIQVFGTCEECRTGTRAVTMDGSTTELVFARDALRIAIATERSGLQFYTRAAAITTDPRGRSVFEKLAGEEKEHLGTLERRYRELISQDALLESRPTFLFFKGAANGIFEIKEHMAAVGLGMLPIYAVYWKAPLLAAHAATRRYLTWILTFLVWWNFLIGHILNNIKGLFS